MTEEQKSTIDDSQSGGENKKDCKDACCGSGKHNEFWCKHLKVVIFGFIGLAVLALTFGAGIKVGTLKARYSYKWADNYHNNFAGPREGFMNDFRKFPAGDFINGHGVFGEIIEIKDNGFVVKGADNVEKIVIINQDTTITKGQETIQDGLKVGDNVVIIGSPNDEGQIEAKLIRIFDKEIGVLPLKRSRHFPLF